MGYKTIVCLAKSRKFGGRCVAGRELVNGQFGPWVRPISQGKAGELVQRDMRCVHGGKPNVLDILRIPLGSHQPQGHQIENYILHPGVPWGLVGRADWTTVLRAEDKFDSAFWRDGRSSYHGIQDRVPLLAAPHLGASLKLVNVHDLKILVVREGASGLRRKVRADFMYHGVRYRLKVTDPFIEHECLKRDRDNLVRPHALLCVSAGKPYKGYVYRLVAAIITPKRCES